VGRPPDLRNLKTEDFEEKDRDLIDRLAFPFNNFMQQVVALFQNGIDFTNLNEQIVTITVTVDSSGKPTADMRFKSTLKTKVQGIMCINAVNQSSTIRFPTAVPFCTFSQKDDLVTISNISGLPVPTGQTNSDKYQLTLRIIGSNIPTA
jgi:hypothetical protein